MLVILGGRITCLLLLLYRGMVATMDKLSVAVERSRSPKILDEELLPLLARHTRSMTTAVGKENKTLSLRVARVAG
jgi:hypothetical protein